MFLSGLKNAVGICPVQHVKQGGENLDLAVLIVTVAGQATFLGI